MDDSLSIVPMTFRRACEYITKNHRHHKPPVGWLFGLGAVRGGELVGVATVGRPVARHYDDGLTAEVTRLCTDGASNACSKLYAAARRVAKEMGYRRIITYILSEESGVSLKASGWNQVHTTSGGSWSCKSRPREDKHPTGPKVLWESVLCR